MTHGDLAIEDDRPGQKAKEDYRYYMPGNLWDGH